MSRTDDDAFDRASAAVVIQTRTRSYYADRDIGDRVHLKHRPEPIAGVITGIGVQPSGIYYHVRWGNGLEDRHWPLELQDDPEL